MVYKKIAINFTLIDQIIYEIITNQFTPVLVAAPLTPFVFLIISLSIIDAPILQNLFHCNFFLWILKTCLLKKLSVKEYSK